MSNNDLESARRAQHINEHVVQMHYDEVIDEEGFDKFSRTEVALRKSTLELAYKRFRKHDEAVICHLPTGKEINAALNRSQEVRLMYYHTIGKYEELFPVVEAPLANSTMNATMQSFLGGNVIRVETARAPEPGEFSGYPGDWPGFRDRFKAEVHDRDFDDVTKLIHLQHACVGAAKTALGEWKPTASNYIKAWEGLERRYDDSYQMEQALISRLLLAVAPQKKETHLTLRTIIDVTSNTLRQLEAMHVDVSSWGPLLVNIVGSKLPRTTADAWEQRRDVINKPTFDGLIEFLEGRARGRAYVDFEVTIPPKMPLLPSSGVNQSG